MTENTEIIEDNIIVDNNIEETPLDELSRVYDELEAKAEPEQVEAKVQARVRDDSGRFAPKTAASEQTSAASELAQPVEKTKIDIDKLGFSLEERKVIATLPDDALEIISNYNERRNNGIDALKNKAEIADSFIGAITPHAEYLKALEVAPEDFISSMLSAEKTLRLGNEQQKINMLQRLAHDYQIPLDKLTEVQFDPNLARLQQELEYRDRYINNLTRAQQANETTRAESYIVEWAQDKEYFNELREPMANLLNAGMATGLDDAYNKAMRLNDGLYEQQQKKQQALMADQKARKALSSSVQVRNNATTGQNIPVFENPLDELRYRAEQMGY